MNKITEIEKYRLFTFMVDAINSPDRMKSVMNNRTVDYMEHLAFKYGHIEFGQVYEELRQRLLKGAEVNV
jgi:hypothetical protein